MPPKAQPGAQPLPGAISPAPAADQGGVGRDLLRAAFGNVLGDSPGPMAGISSIAAMKNAAARAHQAMKETTSKMAAQASAAASDAIESSLEQIVAFREDLFKYGYEMNGILVKMSIVPEVEVEFLIHEGASLEDFPEEEEELTDVQHLLLQALEKKASLDELASRNGMVFTAVKVVLTVPPSVCIGLGFRGRPGDSSSGSSDGEETQPDKAFRQAAVSRRVSGKAVPTQGSSPSSRGTAASSRGSPTAAGGRGNAAFPLAAASAAGAANGHLQPSALPPTRSMGPADASVLPPVERSLGPAGATGLLHGPSRTVSPQPAVGAQPFAGATPPRATYSQPRMAMPPAQGMPPSPIATVAHRC
mmetsp:Transcript_96834/g.289213  ORF Transcript_96834/g.289213 Transcript_96834/m.289213 type:complete len:361 (-) Transcript_96834:70-1152(-)